MATNETVLIIVTAIAARRRQPSPDPLDEQDAR